MRLTDNPTYSKMNDKIMIEYNCRFNELSNNDKVAIINLINTLASHATTRCSYTDIIQDAMKKVWNRFINTEEDEENDE